MSGELWKPLSRMGIRLPLLLFSFLFFSEEGLAHLPPVNLANTSAEDEEIRRSARKTTVRILGAKSSGSGVIVDRQGETYLALTNWHVVAFADRLEILTSDGKRYLLQKPFEQVEATDLALVRFVSGQDYEVASIRARPIAVGERVYASGFPMYRPNSLATTFEDGVGAFYLTVGWVSLVPSKSLALGYRLGYTNDIQMGMSGGPIFDRGGLLVGVNGRIKNRDPAFGVYTFDDGTEPPPRLLAEMTRASWGIPIGVYLQWRDRT